MRLSAASAILRTTQVARPWKDPMPTFSPPLSSLMMLPASSFNATSAKSGSTVPASESSVPKAPLKSISANNVAKTYTRSTLQAMGKPASISI